MPRTGGRKAGRISRYCGYKKPSSARIIFLYAFAKNEKANLTTKEEAALSLAAESFILTTDKQIAELLKVGSIFEVEHDHE